MTRMIAGILACSIAPAAMAQDLDFEGLWRSNPTTDCAYTGGEGTALKVEDDVLYGVENQCRMSRPVDVRDMDAILFDMECEGEAENFVERAMFMGATDGGLYLIWDGIVFKYESCGEDPAVGTVTTADQIGIPE